MTQKEENRIHIQECTEEKNSIGGKEMVAASPVVRLGVTGRPLPRGADIFKKVLGKHTKEA